MLRKFVLLLCLTFATYSSQAQESSFGVTAGYLNAKLDYSSDAYDASENISGFYIGGLIDIVLTETLHLGLGANYANSKDAGLVYIPLMLKYYIAETGLFVQGGPQASFFFEKNSHAQFETIGIDLGLGAGYEINEHYFIEAKYNWGITNRLDGISENNDLKLNSLLVGLGYKF